MSMGKVQILCGMHQQLMLMFSQRTIDGLKQHSLFRLMLPTFQSFLAFNVNKEIKKDHQLIQHAANLVNMRVEPGDEDINLLLDRAREIDRIFLQQINLLPVAIQIQYHVIETIRRQRIKFLLEIFCYLLLQWQGNIRFRSIIKVSYREQEFEKMIYAILELYSQETKQLSHSVRIPAILGMARDSLSNTVYDVMSSVAIELASDVRSRFYS